MAFPLTAEEFGALRAQGYTVIYAETESESHSPGDGWSYWRDRITPDETVAVWRQIVTLEEAAQWEAQQDAETEQ